MRFFLSLDRILLYLSAAGASVAIWRKGRLREVSALSTDQEGWDRFDALLTERPRAPVSIVMDTVEEQFRDEILPRAYGTDRREMAQRRLRQLLVQSPYRAVLRQGPAGKGRQGDHYLFMGLTGHELLRPWLEMIHLHRAPLAGIWLAPALSRNLLRRLGLEPGRTLLVSEQTGGLRLSFFETGRLRFSRLAPVDNALFDNPLEGYGDEIERTRQYLLSQRLLAREEKLQVYLIDPLDSLNELHALLPESAGFRVETIARPRLVADLGLPPSLLTESTDALYLSLLPNAEPEANLQPPEMRAAYRRFLTQRWLYGSGAVWLALCILVSGVLWLETWRQNRQLAEYAQLTEQTLRAEQRLVGSPSGVQALRLRMEQLQAWRHVDDRDFNPAADMGAILGLLDTAQPLRILQVEWRGPGDSLTREIRLSGEVSPFNGDFQAAHRYIEDFVERLRQSGWQVGVEQWPMDTSPQAITSGELAGDTNRMHTGFRLFLRRVDKS